MSTLSTVALVSTAALLACALAFVLGRRTGTFKASGSVDVSGVRWSVEIEGDRATVTAAPQAAGKLAAPTERVVVPLEVRR